MTIAFFLMYLLIGSCAGMLAGLLGIGGGIIVVPALAMVFGRSALMPPDLVMHMAIGTSLGVMILTLLSALKSHQQRGNVQWDVVKRLVPGLVLGALIGSTLAHYFSSHLLKILFGVFLCFIAVRMLTTKHVEPTERQLPRLSFMTSIATVIGGLSSLLGAGGGILLIPFLLRCQLNMRQASGTAIACGVGIGLVATASFVVLGFASKSVPYSTGYIYWPAFVGIAMTSVLFAPLGASLGHKLPTLVLKQILAVFLLIVAFNMLYMH